MSRADADDICRAFNLPLGAIRYHAGQFTLGLGRSLLRGAYNRAVELTNEANIMLHSRAYSRGQDIVDAMINGVSAAGRRVANRVGAHARGQEDLSARVRAWNGGRPDASQWLRADGPRPASRWDRNQPDVRQPARDNPFRGRSRWDRNQPDVRQGPPDGDPARGLIQQSSLSGGMSTAGIGSYARPFRKKRFKGRKRKKVSRLPPEILSKCDVTEAYNLAINFDIVTTNSALHSTWMLGALCDYGHISRTIAGAGVVTPSESRVLPDFGYINHSETVTLSKNNIRVKLTNVDNASVVITMYEILFKRDQQLLGGLPYSDNMYNSVARNLFAFLQQYDGDVYDPTIASIVFQGGTAPGSGTPGVPPRVLHVQGAPFPWKPIDPYIKRINSKTWLLHQGQSMTHTIKTKPFKWQVGYHGLRDRDAGGDSWLTPDSTNAKIPNAYQGLTKLLMMNVKTVQMSRSSEGADANESYVGGSYKLVCDLKYHSRLSAVKYQAMNKQMLDYRPDIAVAASEVIVGDVEVKDESA